MDKSFADWVDKLYGSPMPSLNPSRDKIIAINELPIRHFNLSFLTEYLSKFKVNQKTPKSPFIQEVIWGEGVGSIRLTINSNIDAVIERLHKDKNGENVWICEDIAVVNDKYIQYKGKEEKLASLLLDRLDEIDKRSIYGFIDKFDLKETCLKIATGISSKVSSIRLDKIVPKNENNYICVFRALAQGNNAPNNSKLEQIENEIVYYPDKGYIKLICNQIESTNSERNYNIKPSELIVNFMPTQKIEEVVKYIVAFMKDNYDSTDYFDQEVIVDI